MTLNVTNKANSDLKFLHRQNRFLIPPLHRLLCNALIKPLFDYACATSFPNLKTSSNTKQMPKVLLPAR